MPSTNSKKTQHTKEAIDSALDDLKDAFDRYQIWHGLKWEDDFPHDYPSDFIYTNCLFIDKDFDILIECGWIEAVSTTKLPADVTEVAFKLTQSGFNRYKLYIL